MKTRFMYLKSNVDVLIDKVRIPYLRLFLKKNNSTWWVTQAAQTRLLDPKLSHDIQ